MKIVALTLAMLLCSKNVIAAACDKTDTGCLLRLTLQQTYALEVSQQENELLRDRLSEAEANTQSGSKYFIIGGVVFTAFFGLTFTLMKHLSK